jgi:hypothetical protein
MICALVLLFCCCFRGTVAACTRALAGTCLSCGIACGDVFALLIRPAMACYSIVELTCLKSSYAALDEDLEGGDNRRPGTAVTFAGGRQYALADYEITMFAAQACAANSTSKGQANGSRAAPTVATASAVDCSRSTHSRATRKPAASGSGPGARSTGSKKHAAKGGKANQKKAQGRGLPPPTMLPPPPQPVLDVEMGAAPPVVRDEVWAGPDLLSAACGGGEGAHAAGSVDYSTHEHQQEQGAQPAARPRGGGPLRWLFGGSAKKVDPQKVEASPAAAQRETLGVPPVPQRQQDAFEDAGPQQASRARAGGPTHVATLAQADPASRARRGGAVLDEQLGPTDAAPEKILHEPVSKPRFTCVPLARPPVRRSILRQAERAIVQPKMPPSYFDYEEEGASAVRALATGIVDAWQGSAGTKLASAIAAVGDEALQKPGATGAFDTPMHSLGLAAPGMVGTAGGTPGLMRRPNLSGEGRRQTVEGAGMSPESPSELRKVKPVTYTTVASRSSPPAFDTPGEARASAPPGQEFDLGLEDDADVEPSQAQAVAADGEWCGDDRPPSHLDRLNANTLSPTGTMSPSDPNSLIGAISAAADASALARGHSPLASEAGSGLSAAHISAAGGLSTTPAVANAGCYPGTSDGKGEGLSALFVHPDEDIYSIGGSILAEPPRTFEALAFAPRVAGQSARRRKLEEVATDDVLSNFASAAALGAHRVPPKVICRCGSSSATSSTWQMWASDGLAEAIGVPADGEEMDAPSDASADAAANAEEVTAKRAADEKAKAEKDKADATKRKGGAKGAAEPEKPTEEPVSSNPALPNRMDDENFKKMHIDYKPVLLSASRVIGDRASPAPSVRDLGAPSTALAKGKEADADLKKRAAAAGLKNISLKTPTGKGKTK